MTQSQMYVLMSAIYLAPNVTPRWRIVLGVICLIYATYYGFFA